MDSANNMLSYSGARSTYKVEVKRIAAPPDVNSIASRFERKETNGGGVRSLSVRDTIRTQIGNAAFSVEYGRPLVRGRTLLGNVIPYDRVWRTGANAATQFTTSTPIKLAGMQVPAGTYTLFIHHYSSNNGEATNAMAASRAAVQVFTQAGTVFNQVIPSTSGIYWDVLRINGSTGAITGTNTVGGQAPSSSCH